jgi:hypothetical protein
MRTFEKPQLHITKSGELSICIIVSVDKSKDSELKIVKVKQAFHALPLLSVMDGSSTVLTTFEIRSIGKANMEFVNKFIEQFKMALQSIKSTIKDNEQQELMTQARAALSEICNIEI